MRLGVGQDYGDLWAPWGVMQTYRLAGDLRLRYTVGKCKYMVAAVCKSDASNGGRGAVGALSTILEHFWAFLASAPPPGDPPPYPKPFQDQYTKILRIYTTGELSR